MTTNYQQLGTQIGALVDEKNAAYGSSFSKAGDFLLLLFPQGVPPHRMADALLLVRIFDKQMRIATDEDAFGESPYQDIAGYGLLGARLHAERKSKECGSVSAAVDEGSKAPGSSAATSAARPTTPNESATGEKSSPPPSRPPSPPTSASTAAPAPNATDGASKSAADLLVRLRDRNGRGQCGICTNRYNFDWTSSAASGAHFQFCSYACRSTFHRKLLAVVDRKIA